MEKLNLIQPMEAKKEIFHKLSKIWSIINNLAQERRIKSEELDDFNQAYRKLNDLVDTIFQTIEMMEKEALGIEQLKILHLADRHKMELCMELCGMSKVGIKHMMNFQIGFLEMAFTLRFKKGKPLGACRTSFLKKSVLFAF